MIAAEIADDWVGGIEGHTHLEGLPPSLGDMRRLLSSAPRISTVVPKGSRPYLIRILMRVGSGPYIAQAASSANRVAGEKARAAGEKRDSNLGDVIFWEEFLSAIEKIENEENTGPIMKVDRL